MVPDPASAPAAGLAGDLVDESVFAHPSAALSPHVAWYSGYRQDGVPPARHRGLPSPYLTLILTIDDPVTILEHPDAAQPPGDFRLLLGGLHTAPALIGHEGRQSGVQVALSPLGARTLLGLPAGALAGVDLPAEDVLGVDAVEAQERLRAAGDWRTRFAVVDGWLRRRAGRADAATPLAPELVRAWDLLRRAGGNLPVGDLAAEVGWSPRHLSGRFAAEFGLTPKAAARVMRFDRTRRRLAGLAARAMAAAEPADGTVLFGQRAADDTAGSPGPGGRGTPTPRRGLGLADLAVSCGYFDQAHMDRDFRALAGCPPVRWLAEEFRNVQAGAHHPEPG